MKKYLISLIISILPSLLSAQLPWSTPQLLCDSIGSNSSPSFVKSVYEIVDYNNLVWCRDFGNHSEIYMKNFADLDSEIAVNPFTAAGYSQKPTASYIDFNYPEEKVLIVWQSNQNGNFDLYSIVYDNGYFCDYQQITSDMADDINPDLAGDFLVWERDSSIYEAQYSLIDSIWSPEFKLDSNSCANPSVNWAQSAYLYTSPIIAYQKKIQDSSQIYIRVKENNQVWGPSQNLSQIGDNRNPVFSIGIDAPLIWQYRDQGDWNIKYYSFWEQDTFNLIFNWLDEINPTGLYLPLADDELWGPTYVLFQSDYSGNPDIYSNQWPFEYLFENISLGSGKNMNPDISNGSWQEATTYQTRVWAAWEREVNNNVQIWGSFTEMIFGAIETEALESLTSFILKQNYPNPFNGETTIEFYLPTASTVAIEIYNLLGQKVKTLWRGQQLAGQHQLHWDGRDEMGREVASGIYLYQLKTDGWRQTKKLILIR
jgi:hypothetical protein